MDADNDDIRYGYHMRMVGDDNQQTTKDMSMGTWRPDSRIHSHGC